MRVWVVWLVLVLVCDGTLTRHAAANAQIQRPILTQQQVEDGRKLFTSPPQLLGMFTPTAVKNALAPVPHQQLAPSLDTNAQNFRQMQQETEQLDAKLQELANQKIEQFAPVTEEGRATLQRIVGVFDKMPVLAQAGTSVASNPTYIMNLLDELRGTVFLWQFYKLLGGQREVEAHHVLLQADANGSPSSGMIKGAGLFFGANVLLFMLLMSELHEYLNFYEYRPGEKVGEAMPQEQEQPKKDDTAKADKAKGDKGKAKAKGKGSDEDEDPNVHEEDETVVKRIINKAKEVFEKAKGPSTKFITSLAEQCHGLVTFNEAGEERPYMKLAFVWTVFIVSWSAQMSLLAATMQSLAGVNKSKSEGKTFVA